ncbi:MAG: hypothetical protein DRP56_10065 [Planctomycetota bacterium]|nr:MAG: hypothetical protein DRP56_10065 [Planctomycetota bacterium]
MTDCLQNSSLDWALKSIIHCGDTDIFPIPFEIESIKNYWPEIREDLVSKDLSDYRTSASRSILMPKTDGTFRIVKQLDPLDSLVYNSLLYEMAGDVESHRVHSDLKVACAYRINIQDTGKVFDEENAWSNYHLKSSELAESGKYTHVLVADIADFYNQIYHHRVENVLESATGNEVRSKSIEKFLGSLTQKQSRGVPVGPIPSIVLAEACLDDVDKKLMSLGIQHTRYVDDFRIFCCSKKQALFVMQELISYLYTAHRLSLQSHKTYICEVNEFIRKELKDPREEEEKKKVKSINDLLCDALSAFGYVFTEEDLDSVTKSRITIDNLHELMQRCLCERPLRLGFARYLLRRATYLRTRKIYDLLLNNLVYLTPVFRDVCLYFAKTLPTPAPANFSEKLLCFLEKSDYGELPYVRMWALELFSKSPKLIPFEKALSLSNESKDSLGIRPAAILAKSYNQIDWVRSYKENWNCHGPWDRRSIIWAGSILSPDEKKAWLRPITEGSDLLDKCVAIKALS